ncbi:MAG: efflux RND transporter periplasmic adaptor subunit [Phycisphaeraceae bacterium]|nr:MAG: efflux RND transporter periplasmic adaptor subunit [Phycisphaeraceae bacterium]
MACGHRHLSAKPIIPKLLRRHATRFRHRGAPEDIHSINAVKPKYGNNSRPLLVVADGCRSRVMPARPTTCGSDTHAQHTARQADYRQVPCESDAEPMPNRLHMTPPAHHQPDQRFHGIRRAMALTVVAVLAGLIGACAGDDTESNASAPEQTSVRVGVVEAWTSPVHQTLSLVGSTRAIDTVSVTAQVTGIVSWIGFDDEDIVEDGDLLVRLDDRRAVADLRASHARRDRARLRFERTESAFGRGAVNQAELDDARTGLDESEAEAERAEAVLADHSIRAPFDGRITRRLISLGALVSPGDAVGILNTVDPIEVVFSVPENHLGILTPGLPVHATTPAYRDHSFEGRLAAIGVQVDPLSRAAEVFARIDNPDALLRPGQFMQVSLYIATRENAVIIPESALVVEGARVEAFVIEDNKATRRRVRVQERFPGLVEIAEGIRAGDIVVTSGVQKLREGTPVDPEQDPDLESLGVIAGAPLDQQPVIASTRRATIIPPAPTRTSGTQDSDG